MKILLLFVFVTACTTPGNQGPIVVTVFDGDWSAADQVSVNTGSTVWVNFGYQYANASNLPECDRYWYKANEANCKLTITVSHDDLDADYEGQNLAGIASQDTRQILLAPNYHGWDLTSIASHEFGHILMDCQHLLPTQTGVMTALVDRWDPTQDDYDLGCLTTGICFTIGV